MTDPSPIFTLLPITLRFLVVVPQVRKYLHAVLKHKGIDVEITPWHGNGGTRGGFQLVRVETMVMRDRVASSYTLWAIILPSRQHYILSEWGPDETEFPLDPGLLV